MKPIYDFPKCEGFGCKRTGCRELVHHGGRIPGHCPRCCPDGTCGTGMGRRACIVQDYTHVAGVACYSCGFYWLPDELPATLRDTLRLHEHPARSRPAVAAHLTSAA